MGELLELGPKGALLGSAKAATWCFSEVFNLFDPETGDLGADHMACLCWVPAHQALQRGVLLRCR